MLSILKYLFMIKSGYIVLLTFYSGVGIKLESFPQAILDNKIYQMILAYIVLHEALGGDFLSSLLVILLYYFTSLFFSENEDKYDNVFGSTLGPYVKEAFVELGIEEYSHEFNSGDLEIIIDKIKD